MFGNVLKITLFKAELSIKVASFYVQGQSELEIKIRDRCRTHFDSTNSMVVSDLANELPLKIIFFEVSLISSIYVEL